MIEPLVITIKQGGLESSLTTYGDTNLDELVARMGYLLGVHYQQEIILGVIYEDID